LSWLVYPTTDIQSAPYDPTTPAAADRQGKGRKDRFAMLSSRLLDLLRDWYRIARPAIWLLPRP
jgi:hypothetical protein